MVLLSIPSSALTDVNVKFVDYVHDYKKYIERTAIFERGDKVKIYVDAKDINRFRAYAVDFAYVVYDPKGYPILGGVSSKSGTGWKNEVYNVFEFTIGDDWVFGRYKVEVYVFDVLNATATYKEYRAFVDRLIRDGSANVDVKKFSRANVDYVKKVVYFQVAESVQSKIYVFDSKLKAKVLPVGMNNSIIFTIFNSGNKIAKFYVKLLIDGEKFGKKKVEVKPWSFERVEFEIPQLKEGRHRIEIAVDWGNIEYARTLPIFLNPAVFEKPISIGKMGKGYIVLSENNYVLGSSMTKLFSEPNFPEKYSVNKENAAKMLTNVLAYLWLSSGKKGEIDVGLYVKSDERAETILPKLLDYISEMSGAPIRYLGVLERDEIWKADVLFYVTDKPNIKELEEFVKKGGILIVDVTDYWFNGKSLREKYSLKEEEKVYTSFFDLNINKTVEIKIKTEVKLPPELAYSNLTISDFLVEVGESVKISFDVKNKGGAGKVPITVYVNDEEIYNETFEFYPGDVKHIELEYVPEKEGSYKVTVNGISKVFFAKEVKEENVTKFETPQPVKVSRRENAQLVAGLVGVLALLVILRIYLKR